MKSRYLSEINALIGRRLSGTFRVYDRALRITRDGWFFTGFIFAVGIASINTGNNLLYLILAVMLGIVVASGVLSEESVRRLHVERSLPNEIRAGEAFQIHYAITNRQRRFSVYGMRVEEARLKAIQEAFFLQIPPAGRAVREGSFVIERRGLFKLGELRLSTKFPFGFFEKIRLIKLPEELVVFPRPAQVDKEATAGFETGSANAPTHHGEGTDLFSLRPYVDGDSLRRIHWKASARTESLVSKETQSENLPVVSVVLDTSGYVRGRDDDALEDAISRTAGYAELFISKGYMVRLATSAGVVPFGTGRLHRRSIMTHLALFDPPNQSSGKTFVQARGNKVIITLEAISKSSAVENLEPITA